MYTTYTNKITINPTDIPLPPRGVVQTKKTIPHKTSLQKELDKEYNQENFFDAFDLAETMDISAIIPTYQRCPYNPKTPEGKLNPLAWCLESLLAQRPKLNEIIIVSDSSDGKEFFLQIVNEDNILFGLLRLRLVKNLDLAMVRELHVYGKAVEIGELKERETQHKGLGKMLMEKYIK